MLPWGLKWYMIEQVQWPGIICKTPHISKTPWASLSWICAPYKYSNQLSLFLFLLLELFVAGQETEVALPDYVVSECYGDSFNFDCGIGNKIRINRDFFGYNNLDSSNRCEYARGDCTISNPKSNSLIHRFCTGRRWCTYYLVERRACKGTYSNYQQVEYQCVPGEMQGLFDAWVVVFLKDLKTVMYTLQDVQLRCMVSLAPKALH